MSASLAHGGLPPGVTHFSLADLIEKIAPGARREERLSATAVRVLKHYLLGCRSSDFEPGKICGVWEQPQTTAQTLRISTKVLHNAEAELERGGFIERTHVPHARRTGQRRDGAIVTLAGISLRPVIDGYCRWMARYEAMELQRDAVAALRHELVILARQIRANEAAETVEKAERILPRGRVSRIESIEKLEALKASLEALLVQLDLPSGDTKSSVRTEEIFAPNIPIQDSSKHCTRAPTAQSDADRSADITPAMAASLASDDYRALLPSTQRPGWPDIVEAAAIACLWHGISHPAWAAACDRMGRERAALSVLVIDRNARLPAEHRYRARSGRKCLAGLMRKTASLAPMIEAARGFAGGSVPDRPFETSPSQQDSGQSFATASQAVLRRFSPEERA
jgi:DNA-binding HxlR family transcriptional regulator